jgi:hypothetical protein
MRSDSTVFFMSLSFRDVVLSFSESSQFYGKGGLAHV